MSDIKSDNNNNHDINIENDNNNNRDINIANNNKSVVIIILKEGHSQ